MNTDQAQDTILVVDDDATNRQILSKILTDVGFVVEMADAGESCKAYLNDFAPALIVMDVILPDMLGTDLCYALKNDRLYEDVPIILISGSRVMAEDFAFGLEIGADDYISRPFAKREFIARIRAVLRFKDVLINRRQSNPYQELSQQTTTQTAAAFEQGSIKDLYPDQFVVLQKRYAAIVKQALAERIYKTDSTLSDAVRDLSVDLGFLKANARDAIDLHNGVLAKLPADDSAQMAYYIKEESKILLVELMGYLVNFYRNAS